MKKILLLFVLLSFLSCASIPSEAPLLSKELGNQIQEIKNSHLNLVHTFFDLKREAVHEYVNQVWLPVYAKSFFSKPGITKVWKQIVEAGSEENRLRFILETAPVLQQELNKTYQELILPLNELEKRLINRLRGKYNNAMAINNTLTSYLVSASEVAENRQRYLNMAGVTEDEISSVINRTESITSEMLKTATEINEGATDIEKTIEEYRNKLNELLNKL